MHSSFTLGRQLSFSSDKEDESLDCIRLFFMIDIGSKKKPLIICLRLYDSNLSKNFFIKPQAIILLYDITSKESFDSAIKYYNDLIDDKEQMNFNYILVGNKIDLIDKENENKEENTINNKVNISYYKQTIEKENFDITKDISGLNGFNLEELLNEIALLLYNSVKLMETRKTELYQIEGDSIIIQNKLEIDNKETSYHDIEYKKEVYKINKSNKKNCCFYCNIF